ncbi:unnamed protein product [Absidia cylindrospora]
MDEVAHVEKVQDILKFTVQLCSDCESSVPECHALIKACHAYTAAMDEILQQPHLPISNELQKIHTTLESTNTLIDEFLKQDNEQRQQKGQSLWSDAGWKVQRRHLIHHLRAVIQSTTEQFNVSQKELHNTLRFSAHCFKEVMVNDACFKFWRRMCGNKIQLSDWSIFAEAYQRQFNESWTTDELEERIRQVACGSSSNSSNNSININEDTPLSISGYIHLTNQCGFPIKYDKVPIIFDPRKTEEAQTLMSVARMINNMIKEAIFAWYEGCDNRDKEAWQERANLWAETIKNSRDMPSDEWDERVKLAEQVDMARRTLSFFYQRFMLVFKIEQTSREMFAQVGFPGRARMHEFIAHVKPLDKANFLVVIKAAPDSWEAKQPKIYAFLMKEFIDKRTRHEANVAPAGAKMLKHVRLDDGTVIDLSDSIDDPYIHTTLQSDMLGEI